MAYMGYSWRHNGPSKVRVERCSGPCIGCSGRGDHTARFNEQRPQQVLRALRVDALCCQTKSGDFGSHFLGFCLGVIERAHVHERGLRHIITFAIAQTFERVDRVCKG
jgi:hypothetical protein